MFKFVEPEHVNIRVAITSPVSGDTPAAEQCITLKMRYAGRTARQDYVQHIQDDDVLDDQVIRDWVVGWDGVCDQDGKAIDWEDKVLCEQVLDAPWVHQVVIQVLLRELMMLPNDPAGAAGKNSQMPPDAGRQGKQVQ